MATSGSSNPELDGGMFAVLERLAATWRQYVLAKLRDCDASEFARSSSREIAASAFGRSKE